ncbi:MAG TPA: DUF481 domain-containing protein [Kofleriaceae bacterium]
MRSNWFVVAALVGVATPAFADPKFEYGKADDLKDIVKPKWLATAELGLLFTTGNSESTSITGGFKVSRKSGDNKFSLEGSGTYAKSGLRVLDDKNGNGTIDDPSEITTVESVTAETLYGKARYDRFLTELDSLFVAAVAARDLPAGKESVLGGQLGYSRRLYKSKTAETVAELGYDFSREDLIVGDPVPIHSIRAFLGHKAAMTEGTDLDAALEVLTNVNHETLPTGADGSAFNDTRVNMKIAISAKIGYNLAVQTSFEAHFDNRPGPLAVKPLAMGFVPEASEVDTIMKASLIYTFAGAEPPKPPAANAAATPVTAPK